MTSLRTLRPYVGSAKFKSTSLWKNAVKEKIDENACHGDVHPERPCPTSKFTMEIKAAPEGAAQRHHRHREYASRQRGMRQKNRQVNRPKPSWFAKDRRSLMQHETEIAVVGDITDKEESR